MINITTETAFLVGLRIGTLLGWSQLLLWIFFAILVFMIAGLFKQALAMRIWKKKLEHLRGFKQWQKKK